MKKNIYILGFLHYNIVLVEIMKINILYNTLYINIIFCYFSFNAMHINPVFIIQIEILCIY